MHHPFIEKVILRELDPNTDERNLEKVLSGMKNKFISDYYEEYNYVDEKELKNDDHPSYSWGDEKSIEVVYCSSSILSLANTSYSYSGGAHGNFGTQYSVYELNKQKKLELNDLIDTNRTDIINPLLEKMFRKKYKLNPKEKLTEILFEDFISPSSNFYMTGKGIGFNYVPYEIAPYAAGEITLFLPFTELKGILKPGYSELLK